MRGAMFRCVNALFVRLEFVYTVRVKPAFCDLYLFFVNCIVGLLSCILIQVNMLNQIYCVISFIDLPVFQQNCDKNETQVLGRG